MVVSCVNPLSLMGLEADLLKSQHSTVAEKLLDCWAAVALYLHLLVINHENQGPFYLMKAESLGPGARYQHWEMVRPQSCLKRCNNAPQNEIYLS